MEGHEDDGEYHARVLVYVTASHSEHGVGRVQQVGMHLEITRIFKYLKLLVSEDIFGQESAGADHLFKRQSILDISICQT